MKGNKTFIRTVCNIAIPVMLQCMLQSSFSMIDQIMIGQLGSVNIAAIGLAGKFFSIFSVTVAAIATVAGIMISQYIGKEEKKEVDKSFSVNMIASLLLAVIFMALCIFIPENIMRIYTKEAEICTVAASYLKILAITFIPVAGATLVSTMLRCMEKASLPLYASIVAAIVNTVLNYVMIFGKFGCPAMGVEGAAIATVISQLVNLFIMLIALVRLYKKEERNFAFSIKLGKAGYQQYFVMLIPILITEFFWSLGENVYASVYGHMGTAACAAMTLTNPIQGLMIGALSGLAQAAGILIGKSLGKEEYDEAYQNAKKLTYYGFVGSLCLSILLILLRKFYVDIYAVEDSVKLLAGKVLVAFAFISPVKVLNMILSGGIIRSGGKTKLVMWIDMIGTWGFGVPLALVTAFVLGMPIYWVYFILSLEEVIRLLIAVVVFRTKTWMQSLVV